MKLEEIKKMFGGVIEVYNNGEYIVGEEEEPIFGSEEYYIKSRLFEKTVNSDEFTEIKTENGENLLILEDSPLFNAVTDCNWLHCILRPEKDADDERFYVKNYRGELTPIGPVCTNIEIK